MSGHENPDTGGPGDATAEFPKSANVYSNLACRCRRMMQFAGLMSRRTTWTSRHALTARANDRIQACTMPTPCPLQLC
eukprot:11226873-Lingulodinium_polyedra.AAC.1